MFLVPKAFGQQLKTLPPLTLFTLVLHSVHFQNNLQVHRYLKQVHNSIYQHFSLKA